MRSTFDANANGLLVSAEKKTATWKTAIVLTGLVFLLSLAATGMIWWREQQKIERSLKTEFDSRADQIVSRIKKRLVYYHQVLVGTQALFTASKHVTHREFVTYIKSLQLQKLYPGMQDIGSTRTVTREQLSSHLEDMRRLYPGYRLWPKGNRALYTAVVQVEQRNGLNTRAIGYDMYADPLRFAAMNRARDTNKLAVTPKTTLLISDADNDSIGFIAYLPIYEYGQSVASVEKRRKNIVGWVFAPFRMRELVARLDFVKTDDVAIDIYDGHGITENALMFRSNHASASFLIRTASLETTRRISFGDRQWTLRIRSLASFESAIDKTLPLYVALFGLLISLLLATLTWSLAIGRARALSLARKMTLQHSESEYRFKLMANAAPVLIWISDLTIQHLWVNRGWAEFTGHYQSDDFGSIWKSFIHPEDLPRLEALVKKSIQSQKAYIAQYRVRRHDGAYRWIHAHAEPRFDENGTFMGYVSSSMDITDRKRAEEKVKLAALVFEHSVDTMTVSEYDRNGSVSIIAVNKAHETMTGYSPMEVIGKSIEIFKSDKHDQLYYQKITQSLAETGRWQGEYWPKRKDGTYFPAWISLSMVSDKNTGTRHLITLCRDISHQKESEKMIKTLSSTLITAKEEEARRIAREIHDDLGQRLFWIRINLNLLPELCQMQKIRVEENVKKLTEAIDSCMNTIKCIATRLRPPMLDFGVDLAFHALIEEFKKNTKINCSLNIQLEPDFTVNDDTATNLYRILQEALTNIARHSNAYNVDITLFSEQAYLHFKIKDDGRGFDLQAGYKHGSHGLTTMRERVSLLDGQIDITTAPNQGVTICVSAPIQQIYQINGRET